MRLFLNVYSGAKKSGLLLCCVFFSLVAEASQEDVNAFLLAARDDASNLESLDELRIKPSALPLEDVELRVNLDEGGFSAGDYKLRLSLGSFSEARARMARWQADDTLSNARDKLALSEALRQRYQQLLTVIGLSSELALGERRIALLEKQRNAYKSFVDSPEFRFVKLLDVEQDLAEARLKQLRLQQEKDLAVMVLGEYGGASKSRLNDSWLKSVDEVMQALAHDVSASGSPLLLNTASAVLFAQKHLDLQRTKDDVLLSFLDVAYDADKDGNEAYSVGFAVKFPLGTTADRGVAEAQTRLSEAQHEQRLLEQVLPQQLQQTRQTLQGLYEAYRLVAERLQDDSLSASRLSVSNPIIMFRVFENTLHWETEKAAIHHKILMHYVDILHLSGQLASQPLKNYLTKHDSLL